MSFQAAADLVTNAVLSTMGRTVRVIVGETETDLTGVYLAPYSPSADANTAYTRPDHHVLFRSTDFSATSATEGDRLGIGDREFYIADRAEDDSGMTDVTIRAT